MAAIDILGYTTLMDIVHSYTSLDNKADYIWAADILSRKCPLIKGLPMIPSNQIMSNIDARRTYLPAPGTRRFNEGVALSASHKTPFTDPIAMVEDYSEVDYSLWKIQNDPNQWRRDEDQAHVEGLTQKMEDLLFYGSIGTDPAAFDGLATRFNSLNRSPNGDSTWKPHVLGAGGSGGDTTSVYILEMGKNKVFGIYPKNLPGGLNIEDLGKHTVNLNTLAIPKYMEALRTHFSWYMGLVAKDERCVQRYANIEVTGTVNTFDEDVLIRLINRLPGSGMSPGTVILVSFAIKEYLDIRAKDKQNVKYESDEIWGPNVTKFRGIPVIRAERIIETETAVT